MFKLTPLRIKFKILTISFASLLTELRNYFTCLTNVSVRGRLFILKLKLENRNLTRF
jgi:hypothetical protein